MRFKLLLPLAALCFLSSATAQAGEAGYAYCPNGEQYVYLYQSLSTFNVLARLKCGEKVEVLGRESVFSTYVRVRTLDGKEGYAPQSAITTTPPATHDQTPASASTAPATNVAASQPMPPAQPQPVPVQPSQPFPATPQAVLSGSLPAQALLPSSISWQQGAPGSDGFYNDGFLVRSLTVSGVTLRVALRDTGWKMRVDVAVVNDSSQRLDVVPAQFTLGELTPKEKALAYQSTEQLAKSINRRTAWANFFTNFGAGLATEQSTSTSTTTGSMSGRDSNGTTYNGSFDAYTTTNTTTPNYAVQMRAAQQQAANNAAAAEANRQLNAMALRTSTVMPGDKLTGAVWFERDKKAQQLLLRAPIGGCVFEFPFALARSK